MASAATDNQLLLWDHPVSSYAQKIRIALREKNIPFTAQTPKGLGSGFPSATDESFASTNPRIEVPVLVDGDLEIFDSTIILEYIEEKFPAQPLLPKGDPAARAKARMIEEVCDTQYEGLNWGLGEMSWFKRADGQGDLEEKLKAQAAHQTKQLQGWLTERLSGEEYFLASTVSAGRTCVSRRFSIAQYPMDWDPMMEVPSHNGTRG